MELEQIPETLAYICKSIESFASCGKKIDDLQEMVGEMYKVLEHVKSLYEEINTVKKDIVVYRAELYQCIGKQTELEFDINQLRNVTQTSAKDCELAERYL